MQECLLARSDMQWVVFFAKKRCWLSLPALVNDGAAAILPFEAGHEGCAWPGGFATYLICCLHEGVSTLIAQQIAGK